MMHAALEVLMRHEPEVRPLDDARSEFYFANRDLIETWAALRTDAAAQLSERLSDLADVIESDLADLTSEKPIVESQRGSGHGRVKVTLEGWAESRVSLCIEWEAKPINAKGDIRVYACLRVTQQEGRTDEDVSRLTELARSQMPGWSSTKGQWPVWRYIKPGAATVQAIVAEARRDFLQLWVGTAPLVDAWASEARRDRAPVVPNMAEAEEPWQGESD